MSDTVIDTTALDTTVTITAAHVERETLSVIVDIPAHEQRATTPLFMRTRQALLHRDNNVCFISGQTAEESGHPLEAHHWIVERCFAEAANWDDVRQFVFRLEALIAHTADFCRKNVDLDDIMTFVDDMTVNGMLLTKEMHTQAGTGVHTIPMPIWAFQAYATEGYVFSPTETIHHEATLKVETPDATVEVTPKPGASVEVTEATSQ